MAVIPNIAMSDTDHTIPKSICLKLSKSISCKPIKSAALPAQPLQLKALDQPFQHPAFSLETYSLKLFFQAALVVVISQPTILLIKFMRQTHLKL